MVMRSDHPIEEYEMVNNPIDLENQISSSANTPSNDEDEDGFRNQGSESESSIIFEELDSAGKSRENDFNDDFNFQTVLSHYKAGGKYYSNRTCYIISAVGIAIWIILLIVYSNGHFTADNLRYAIGGQSDIVMGGRNVTLNGYNPENKNLTMHFIRHDFFNPNFKDVNWLSQKQYPKQKANGGGYYLAWGQSSKGGLYVVKQIDSDYQSIFIDNLQFKYNDGFYDIEEVFMNPAESVDNLDTYHIVKTNSLKQWRHSSFAIYWLYNPSSKNYIPIQPDKSPKKDNEPEKLHFAGFAPTGDKVLFGYNHDLFIHHINSQEVTRITDTGSPDIFNGKPDWIYEEEVLSSDKFFWWSPDGENVVYVSVDDTDVHSYEMNYYVKGPSEIGDSYEGSGEVQSLNSLNQYPIKKNVKYPKPGTPNPKLSIFNYNVKDKKASTLKDLGDDSIIYDAFWVDNDYCLFKITDRTSRKYLKQVIKVISKDSTDIENFNATEKFGGWIDKISSPISVEKGYIDKVIVNDRSQLAYYETPVTTDPHILTNAKDWDVIESAPVVYDAKEKLLYTLSTKVGSMNSHITAVSLNGKSVTIFNEDIDGSFDFKASDDGQFMSLIYDGPDFPWQKLISLSELHDSENANEYISKKKKFSNYKRGTDFLSTINMPTRSYQTVKIKDVDINVIEILPPGFNPNRKKKYPVLVNSYGGPGSQMVKKKFTVGFEDVASALLDAIVLIIDPRGTDGQGWKFKSYATNKIGYWEGRDIITITSDYVSKNSKVIDSKSVSIWGWSYGGFTTLKTLEIDGGKTFQFGMAVAPVTNWLFYDSIYTERYMMKPQDNPNYSTTGRIVNVDFSSLNRFLIMHGTADDNVHFQNSLWLLDQFNIEGIENYDTHFFPDNDHSIYYHNSNTIVYDKLLHWLRDAFMGRFNDFL